MSSSRRSMSQRIATTIATLFAVSTIAFGQGRGSPAPATPTTAPAIAGVVAAGTRVEVIKDGFNGTEGPIALSDGSVIFSETTANRTVKVSPDGTVSTFLEETAGANGLAFDTEGRLVATLVPWGASKVAIIYPAGAKRVLADGFNGQPFGRANDLTVARNGGIYFTDSANATDPQATPPLPPALYYLPPGGKPTQVLHDVAFPNGVLLSRDERTLYLNDTRGEYLLAFDVKADGTLANRRTFAKYEGVVKNADGSLNSGADGITIDSDGRLYVAAVNGVQVFSPDGQHLGTIPLSRVPQNLAFAGPDKSTLYVVGRGAAYRVRMLAHGFAGRPK
jgi:gluconolactonase